MQRDRVTTKLTQLLNICLLAIHMVLLRFCLRYGVDEIPIFECNAELIKPSFTKGTKLLSAKKLKESCKLFSVRFHVEEIYVTCARTIINKIYI